jgi:hypothetical protein
MTDCERMIAARRFFWEQVGDQIIDAETAKCQIRKLAEALPPFTKIKESA